MFLQYLRVNLPYSYRVVAGMQGLGLLVFTNQIYLYYENEFGLKILATSNGYYNFTSRLESFSLNYAMGPIVLFSCYLVAYFSMYSPIKTFCKAYADYKEYLY